jgi:glucose dehydrogenase
LLAAAYQSSVNLQSEIFNLQFSVYLPFMRRTVLFSSAAIAFLAVFLAAQTPAPVSEWRHYGADAGSTKYSPLAQITRANVNTLQIAWRWSSPDNEIAKANAQAQPGVYDDTPVFVSQGGNGRLYTITSLGLIAALDPGTGKTVWQYDPGSWKGGRVAGHRISGTRTVASPTGQTARSSASSSARTTPT